MKIGITGQNGFIGWHLFNTIKYKHTELQLVPFSRVNFYDSELLSNFLKKCDVLIHLGGLNRAKDKQDIYNTNIDLTYKLCNAIEVSGFKGKIIFASSIQESKDSAFGRSKKESRKILIKHSEKYLYKFIGLIIPNIFGPFGRSNYNSFIATFCNKIINKETPIISEDNNIELLYVDDIIKVFIDQIKSTDSITKTVTASNKIKVSEVLKKLDHFNKTYVEAGNMPDLSDSFELNLFNTFRSYIDYESIYPKAHLQSLDLRGSFSEIIRSGSKGQFSFSTTKPNITRGNHFHTRKIERFSVIQGKAKIELRQVGSSKKTNFVLDGEIPSYVDIPIWHTHNIKNIGENELIALFWINEAYNPKDADTYSEIV